MPGSISRSMRSRASSLPRERWRSIARSPPPAATCARARPQLLDELLHPRLPAREVVGSLDTALQQRHGQSVDHRFGHSVSRAAKATHPAGRRRDRRCRHRRRLDRGRVEQALGADRRPRSRPRRTAGEPHRSRASRSTATRSATRARRRRCSSSRIRSARSARSGRSARCRRSSTDYVKTGRVKLVYRGIEVIGPNSRPDCARSTPPACRTSSGTSPRRSTASRARRTAAGSPTR